MGWADKKVKRGTKDGEKTFEEDSMKRENISTEDDKGRDSTKTCSVREE
jgi:hypothetical protein